MLAFILPATMFATSVRILFETLESLVPSKKLFGALTLRVRELPVNSKSKVQVNDDPGCRTGILHSDSFIDSPSESDASKLITILETAL